MKLILFSALLNVFFGLWDEWRRIIIFGTINVLLFLWIQAVLFLIYILKWFSVNVFIKICLYVMKINLAFRLLGLYWQLLYFLFFFALFKNKVIYTFFFIILIWIFFIWKLILLDSNCWMISRWIWNSLFLF